MRSMNHTYSSATKLLSWVEEVSSGAVFESVLVQIFDGSLDHNRVNEITKAIKTFFPEAVIIGSSSSGEISEGEVQEDTTLISVTGFNATHLKAFSSDKKNAYDTGKELALSLIGTQTQCVIMFVDGLDYDTDTLLNSFNEVGGDKVLIAGGVSGDKYTFSDSFVFLDTHIVSKGVVAVALESTELHCFTDYNFGWKSVGKSMLVTRSEKNCIYEIDNKPVLSVYAEYLGKEVLKNAPQSIMEFPLTFEDDGFRIARSAVNVTDDKGIVFSGPINEGTAVRFGIEDENKVISTTADIYIKASMQPLESVFVYSCAVRKTFFNNHLELEYKALSGLAPEAGFITYGQFINIKGKNRLLNVTSVILGLSESDEIKHKIRTDLFDPKPRRKTAEAISTLLEVTTSELDKQLQENNSLIMLLEQYKDALDKSTLVSKTDTRGIITYSNSRFCELSGYSESELVGKPHSIVRHPDTPKATFEEMWRQLKNKQIWSGMLQNRNKDGSSYYVHATIFPILDEFGEVFEYMALREDLTSMILYEKNLEEQQERLHQILNNQDSIVVLTEPSGKVIFLNKKFFDCFHFKDINDFLDQHECICELFTDEKGKVNRYDKECHLEGFDAEGEEQFQQVHILDRQKEVLTFRVGTKSIILDNKRVYLSTLTDITEVEAARIRAEEAKNAKADFLANMSHEIRTPMNGIIGFTALLGEGSLNEEQRHYLEIIQNSADMLLNVVNNILDFSKIEQAKLQVEFVNFNLFREMEYLYMNYLASAQEKGLSYHLDVDRKIDECLYMDGMHLKQVISNLVNNAIKFTPQGESVHIRVSLVEDENSFQKIAFSIEDTGIGISSDRQSKIFESFSQEDTSTTREYGGTGLGLSISASLVSLMEGEISLESKKYEGSTFSFVLRVEKCKTAALRIGQFLKGCEVQVLEDPKMNEHVCEYLTAHAIKNRVSSINKLKSEKSDAIIMFDITEAIGLHQKAGEAPFVVCIDNKAELSHLSSSLQTINCYHRCSTRLYNVLYQHAALSLDTSAVVTETFDGSRIRVLVAEDNEVNQMLIKEILGKYSVSSIIVDNGEEAFERAQKENFDLILMDINMPIMNGVDAAKKIMSGSVINANTPIVALTSNVLEEDVSGFMKVGMYAHLGKPIKNSDIYELLSELFEPKPSQDVLLSMSNEEIGQSLQEAGILLELPNDVMLSLLQKFLLTTEDILQQMQQADKEQDFDALVAQAHKLRGSSSALCFHKIKDISVEIEKAARKEKKLGYMDAIKQLYSFYEDIQNYALGDNSAE